MITSTQMSFLEKVINAELQLNILEKNRSIPYVNGRLIFSYILHKRGVTYHRIANHLGKNHATIIHTVKNAEHYLKHEPDLKGIYNICKTIFENEHNPVLEYSHEELLKAYLDLELQLYSVESELNEAQEYIKNNEKACVDN
tara:strand:+ start:48 stop:473 length:426 start_codon:yes stop_codon:yes gene_type:complete